jgi:hypothetical protein
MAENYQGLEENSGAVIGKINMAGKGIVDMLEEASFVKAIKDEVQNEVSILLLAAGNYFLVSDIESLREIYRHIGGIYNDVLKRKQAITGAFIV